MGDPHRRVERPASLGRTERRPWLRGQAKGKGQRPGGARARISNGGVWGAREALAGEGGSSGSGGGFLHDRPGQVSAGPQRNVSGGRTIPWAPAMELVLKASSFHSTSEVERQNSSFCRSMTGDGTRGAGEVLNESFDTSKDTPTPVSPQTPLHLFR